MYSLQVTADICTQNITRRYRLVTGFSLRLLTTYPVVISHWYYFINEKNMAQNRLVTIKIMNIHFY